MASNVDEVVDLIQTWAAENHDKVFDAYMHKGGWEGWTQVELAIWLMRKLFQADQGFLTNRELQVYENGSQRADIVIQPSQQVCQYCHLEFPSS